MVAVVVVEGISGKLVGSNQQQSQQRLVWIS